MKTLYTPPAQLMVVEATEQETDPYNSGLHRALGQRHVEFLRDGRRMVGDLDTAFTEEELL